jgi:hypothetical protein
LGDSILEFRVRAVILFIYDNKEREKRERSFFEYTTIFDDAESSSEFHGRALAL